MGKLAILLVTAAAVGGSLLTLNTQRALGDSAAVHGEGQAGVVAREIAESGQSLALSQMLGPGGFRNPGLDAPRSYEGGEFQVEVEALTSERATISVTGTYGGAVHTIRSTHQYDALEAPAPLWLDVPYATMKVSGRPRIEGGPNGAGVLLDRRKHDEHDLDFLPLGDLNSLVGASAREASSSLAIPGADDWAASRNGLLEDLNVEDTEGLYQAAVAAIGAGDRKMSGDQTVGTSQSWGGAGKVTFIDGDLTVSSGGRVSGQGALAINGSLKVLGELDWDGLVIVRSTEDELPIELDGKVTIDGSIAVAHSAFPPGGHLDVSVYRSASGMSSTAPWGAFDGSPLRQLIPSRYWPLQKDYYPFHQHTHAFDLTPTTAPRGTHVRFLSGGRADRHEAETQFHSLLQSLGSRPVYLEFANSGAHGYSRFNVEVEGWGPVASGSPRTGFPEGMAQGTGGQRSAVFPANKLRRFDMDVQSLRALKKAFDDGSCSSWPVCIGRDWQRRGALAFRLMEPAASGPDKRLYEATFYWHMREDEKALHEAEELAWRQKIQAGGEFGTHLRMGDDVRITYAQAPINALTEKLGFDGDEVFLAGTSTKHVAAAEARAESATGTAGPPAGGAGAPTGSPSGTNSGGQTETQTSSDTRWVCHRSGDSRTSVQVPRLLVIFHLFHGDSLGQCSAATTTGTSGGQSDDDDDD